MLKPFSELVEIDVLPFCEKRKAKDDNGKTIEVPYLNWATCKLLLHKNGAERVDFQPLKNEQGSFLFASREVANKDGRKTGCYFVAVEIHIDDQTFRMDMPLLNGSLVVYDDTLNQLRISNAHARAFVKGVAIHTGLGFSLWASDKDTDDAVDDLSIHSAKAIRERIERAVSEKLRQGWGEDELLTRVGMKRKQFESMLAYLSASANFEIALKKL